MTASRSTFLTVAALLAATGIARATDVEGLPSGELPKKQMAQKCMNDIQAFDEELWRIGFGVLPMGGYGSPAPPGYSNFYVYGVEATPRRKMQAFRDAAYVYAFDGDEEACQRALASMRAVYGEHQKLIGAEADRDGNVRTAWRRAHLARSKPVAQMDHLMRAEVFIGSEIRNLKDERLGDIQDIVINPEKRDILYVLVSRGGFLGVGGKLAAIRWSDLRATEDHELYVLDVPPKALDDAPAVDRRNFAATASPEWQRALSQFWDRALK